MQVNELSTTSVMGGQGKTKISGGGVYFEAVVTGVGSHHFAHSRSAQRHPARQTIITQTLNINRLSERELALEVMTQYVDHLRCLSPVQVDHLDWVDKCSLLRVGVIVK